MTWPPLIPPPAMAALKTGTWDYVVLQEQSMLGVATLDGKPVIADSSAFHAQWTSGQPQRVGYKKSPGRPYQITEAGPSSNDSHWIDTPSNTRWSRRAKRPERFCYRGARLSADGLT